MQLCIVAPSTCFVRKSASISLVGFLPSEILLSVTIAFQKNTVSMCFTRPSPRGLPIAIPAVASIHTWALNFYLQSWRMLSRPSICDVALTNPQYTASPELSATTACPLQHVQTVLPPSMNAQPETLFRVRIQLAWSVSHQDSIRVTRFCHLNKQINLGRTPRNRANLFEPISSRFDGCCILRARSRYSICISGLSLERYCARVVFARCRSDASLSIGTFPSMSVSLSLTPPNDFLMNSACR